MSLRDSICGLIDVVVKPGLRKVASKSLNSEVCRVVPGSVGHLSGALPLSIPRPDVWLASGYRLPGSFIRSRYRRPTCTSSTGIDPGSLIPSRYQRPTCTSPTGIECAAHQQGGPADSRRCCWHPAYSRPHDANGGFEVVCRRRSHHLSQPTRPRHRPAVLRQRTKSPTTQWRNIAGAASSDPPTLYRVRAGSTLGTTQPMSRGLSERPNPNDHCV